MKNKSNPIIGVIGQGQSCSDELLQLAEQVGAEIAKKKSIVICGGLGGVMEAACRGAKKEGGLTIGVLPGTRKTDANSWIDLPIVTGIGEARNSVIVRTADGLIAIGGQYGTLSEIAFALKFSKPIVGLETWQNIPDMVHVDQPEQAVNKIFSLMKYKR